MSHIRKKEDIANDEAKLYAFNECLSGENNIVTVILKDVIQLNDLSVIYA